MPFSSECPVGKNWQDVGTPMIWDRAQGPEGKCSHHAWQVEKEGSEEAGWAARGDPGHLSQCREKTEVSNSDHPNTVEWNPSPARHCTHDGT